MNLRITMRAAARIVPLVPHNVPRIHGASGYRWDCADGDTVTATRVDDTGSASGEVFIDDGGDPWAIFDAAALPALSTWDLATSSP